MRPSDWPRSDKTSACADRARIRRDTAARVGGQARAQGLRSSQSTSTQPPKSDALAAVKEFVRPRAPQERLEPNKVTKLLFARGLWDSTRWGLGDPPPH